jgi:hypothetical protein
VQYSSAPGPIHSTGQSDALHEIPTSPSRAIACFSSHSAQSTASLSSSISFQPLTPSVSPKWVTLQGSIDNPSSTSTRTASSTQASSSGIIDQLTSTTSTQVQVSADDTKHHQEKQYSFIALPGSHVRKRPRRRYDEIERLYECNWPGCTKAYGTLNHLNAHVHMQKHGSKRTPQGKSSSLFFYFIF